MPDSVWKRQREAAKVCYKFLHTRNIPIKLELMQFESKVLVLNIVQRVIVKSNVLSILKNAIQLNL